MKTMTCRQLGGPCDLELRGETADDVIKAQDTHQRGSAARPGDGRTTGSTLRRAPHRRHEGGDRLGTASRTPRDVDRAVALA